MTRYSSCHETDGFRTLGHDFVDLVKIDLEGMFPPRCFSAEFFKLIEHLRITGWEFAALVPLFEAYRDLPLPFGQLQLEIHANEMPLDKVLEWYGLA